MEQRPDGLWKLTGVFQGKALTNDIYGPLDRFLSESSSRSCGGKKQSDSGFWQHRSQCLVLDNRCSIGCLRETLLPATILMTSQTNSSSQNVPEVIASWRPSTAFLLAIWRYPSRQLLTLPSSRMFSRQNGKKYHGFRSEGIGQVGTQENNGALWSQPACLSERYIDHNYYHRVTGYYYGTTIQVLL